MSTVGAPATAAVDGSTHAVRLRDLQRRIDELKEQVRRSHTRLSLLSDTILSSGASGAQADIAFRNDLSGAFRLTQAIFVLDGIVQYNRQDDSESGLLAGQKQIPIFSGSIPPGEHTLQVVLRLRGHGYGVFSYLRAYRVELKSTHSFTVRDGKAITLEAVAWEKGDLTTPIDQRPDIRYLETLRTGTVERPAPRAAAADTTERPAAKPAAASSGAVKATGGVSVGAGGK